MLYKKSNYIRDIKDKDMVLSPFLLKTCSMATGKNGKPYLNLIFMDKTGEIEGRIWEDATNHMSHAVKDNFVFIEGRCQMYQGRRQLVVSRIQILREEEVDLKEYISEVRINTDSLSEKLRAQVESITDPNLKVLAQAVFFEDEEVQEKIKLSPAAKSLHHAYRGGLLEHIVTVVDLLDSCAKIYTKGRNLDRDLLILGGLFHDIGKIWELTFERITEYTTPGQLLGHIVMGTEYVEKKITELENKNSFFGPFSPHKRQLLKHLILSHHGEMEYGSPKVPLCLEAILLHYVDTLDSKFNSVQSFVEQDQTPGEWSSLHKNLQRFFLKPDPSVGKGS